MTVETAKTIKKNLLDDKEILADYKLAVESREDSLIGRKEVFMGKAKFGIFGDGKEVPSWPWLGYSKTVTGALDTIGIRHL